MRGERLFRSCGHRCVRCFRASEGRRMRGSTRRRRRCLARLARQLRPAEQMEAVQREATVLCSTSPSSSLPSLSPRVPHRSQQQGRRRRCCIPFVTHPSQRDSFGGIRGSSFSNPNPLYFPIHKTKHGLWGHWVMITLSHLPYPTNQTPPC